MSEIPRVGDVVKIMLAEMPDNAREEQEDDIAKSLDVMMGEPDVLAPYLWGNVFPKGEYVGVVGKSGVNKSTFCRQLCISIATNQQEFLGIKLTPYYGRTLYCYSEENENWIRKYMRMQLRGLRYDPAALKNMDVIDMNKFDTGADFITYFQKRLSMKTYDLIVLDSYSDFIVKFDAKLNDNDSIRKMKKQIEFLKQGGCSVLFNHHTSDKANGMGTFLGANAFRQIARAQLEIFALGKERVLSCEKVQYGTSFDSLVCDLSDDFLFVPTGRTMSRGELFEQISAGDYSSAAAPVGRPKAAPCDEETVAAVFGGKGEMTTGEIYHNLHIIFAISDSSAKRWLGDVIGYGFVEQVRRGLYREVQQLDCSSDGTISFVPDYTVSEDFL